MTSGARATAIWGNAPVRTDASGKALEILPVGSYVTNPTAVSTQRDTIIGDANPDELPTTLSRMLPARRPELSEACHVG